MDGILLREVAVGTREHEAAVRLREEVLRVPLGLTLSAEEIAGDAGSRHFVAMKNGAVIATLLLQPLDSQTVRMRQVAVRPDAQRTGVGSGLVRFAEEVAREDGVRSIVAHARETAVLFYERLGYVAESGTFLENTIPHRRVGRSLR